MTRILLAGLSWFLFVGGLHLYMARRDAALTAQQQAIALAFSRGHHTIEITPTFTAEPNPFALRLDESPTPAALLVRLNDKELLRLTDRVAGGRPVMIEEVKGLVLGANEIFIEASPPDTKANVNHAVRVRVFRDDVPVSDTTLWSEGGSAVSGVVRFELKAAAGGDNHDH